MPRIRFGEILRYPRDKDPLPAFVDRLPNFRHVTASPGNSVLLDAGISAIARITAVDGPRRPAIMIRSSPWRAGSAQTPWHDVFDLDNGHVRYFGDCKPSHDVDAATTKGNAALLDAFTAHHGTTPAERERAVPLLVFRSVPRDGKPKGQVEFCGLGILERAERVVQRAAKSGLTFANYVYDIALLDLSAQGETVDWKWINARRDVSLSLAQTTLLAPSAWNEWISRGSAGLPRLRRRVLHSPIHGGAEQRLAPDSPEGATLDKIYRRFDGDKHSFEILAAEIAARVIRGRGVAYTPGWITRRSADGGADFVGRIDIGHGLAGTRLIVLGQAKCIKPKSSISAERIARVVARLQRGWIGVYVTTGIFSTHAQEEVHDDRYPVIMINGARLVEELNLMANEDYGGDIGACIDELLARGTHQETHRRPEELLGL